MGREVLTKRSVVEMVMGLEVLTVEMVLGREVLTKRRHVEMVMGREVLTKRHVLFALEAMLGFRCRGFSGSICE